MITFIDYQYKGIGGVGQIVVNTTLELNRQGKQSKIYCSTESYEYKRLIECNASFQFIDSDIVSLKKLKKYIKTDDVLLVTNINDSPLFENIKHMNNKMIFYSVHPDTFFCYIPQLEYLCNQRKAAIQLIEKLIINDSIFFMDWPNVKAVYDRGLAPLKSIRYLPVPVLSYTGMFRSVDIKRKFNVTYIGRGNSVWKIYPVIKILEDLNNIDQTTYLTIITDDNTLFQQFINDLIPNNKVRVDFINNLFGENLEKYLLENSTLHISMGTSALEGGKLGIPTICIDYSKEKFPNQYKYRWLYECEDYSLAGEIKDGILPYGSGRSLDKIFSDISSKEGYLKESISCRKYVESNHLMPAFIQKLEIACEQTRMTTRKYCSTKFSKNMYYLVPILLFVAKLKHLIQGNGFK